MREVNCNDSEYKDRVGSGVAAPGDRGPRGDNTGGEINIANEKQDRRCTYILTHCGRVTQICVFNTGKLGTSASSP